MSAKRIAIYDYSLDNFHANVYLSALRGPLQDRGFDVAGATAILEEESKKWCIANQVEYFSSLEQLANQSDYLMILAPSNPERHLEMCERAFPLGKPTFIDKTFAPNLQTAEQLFDLAETHNVSIQSTSALRSTNVQRRLADLQKPLDSMIIHSSGPTFEEYGIHPLELAISCLGANVSSFLRLGNQEVRHYVLQYREHRSASIYFHQCGEVPFSATLVTAAGHEHVDVEMNSLFVDAAASILDFFDAGTPQFDNRETLVIREMLDLADQPELIGKVIQLRGETESARAFSAPHWDRSTIDESAHASREDSKSHAS